MVRVLPIPHSCSKLLKSLEAVQLLLQQHISFPFYDFPLTKHGHIIRPRVEANSYSSSRIVASARPAPMMASSASSPFHTSILESLVRIPTLTASPMALLMRYMTFFVRVPFFVPLQRSPQFLLARGPSASLALTIVTVLRCILSKTID